MLLSNGDRCVIGIMGLDVMGDAVRHHFERKRHQVRVYDPGRGLGSESEINEAELLFICVPTPYQPPRGFDSSAVEDAVSLLTGSKVIVIKSTALPGTTEAFQCRYPQHCFLTNPEFLRQSSARADFLRPDRQIVGYTARSRHLAESILALLPQAPYSEVMPAREAELAKYMTNALLALKVTFANEIYDLCAALDADYTLVRDAVAADPRIGASHLDIFEGGYRGYGGACLPKDTKALLDLASQLDVPLRLLRIADETNASLLPGEGADPTQPPLTSACWLEVLAPEPAAGEEAA